MCDNVCLNVCLNGLHGVNRDETKSVHCSYPEKAQRLKEAKEEAAKEIEDYRKEREGRFQEQQRTFIGSKDDFTAKIDEESVDKLRTIDIEVEQGKEKVIDRLLELIYDIQPELHINAKNI